MITKLCNKCNGPNHSDKRICPDCVHRILQIISKIDDQAERRVWLASLDKLTGDPPMTPWERYRKACGMLDSLKDKINNDYGLKL